MNTTLNNIDILLIKSEILLASDGKYAIDTETVYKLFALYEEAKKDLQKAN